MASLEANDADQGDILAEQIRAACEELTPVHITGSGSKQREGRLIEATPVSTLGHRGIIEYSPTELVITVRAGTPLVEVENRLARERQMLPFEPPHLGEGTTIGGTIACGLSGPRRPYVGAVRDMVLGTRIINGLGEILRFGGQVMKNVAGYDVSRLMVGAQGTLGVLLDISIKVMPVPEWEQTLCLQLSEAEAIEFMNRLASKPVPLSAACIVPEIEAGKGQLWLRLSGVETAVKEAKKEIGGELIELGKQFWFDLCERKLDFFKQPGALWRLSLPPASPPLQLPGSCLVDWGGAQRWLVTQASAQKVREVASDLGGHATLYGDQGAELSPLTPSLSALHQRVKDKFDPQLILNPGRLYDGL
jgi:glycolate oxidase FAD binding subunit